MISFYGNANQKREIFLKFYELPLLILLKAYIRAKSNNSYLCYNLIKKLKLYKTHTAEGDSSEGGYEQL